VAAAVGLAAVVAVVLVLVGRPDRSAAAGSTESVTTAPDARVLPEQCVKIGSLSDDVAAEPDAPQDAATLRSLYEAAGGGQRLGCAVAPAHRWRGLLVQEYEGEPDLPGAVVVTGAGTGIVLDPAQWGSYRRVGAADGSQAQRVGGVPERIVPRPDGSIEVELSRGVVMVAESRNAPYFWILADYVAWWRSHPELGLPTANPLPSLTQEFQHGQAKVTATSAGLGPDPEVTLVGDPAAELPPPPSRRRHILREPDGTAWWIDAQDRRHWIASAEVWQCLGGEAVAFSEDVPGYAIATLPLAPHAACSDRD
jgi:hypothetical protein